MRRRRRGERFGSGREVGEQVRGFLNRGIDNYQLSIVNFQLKSSSVQSDWGSIGVGGGETGIWRIFPVLRLTDREEGVWVCLLNVLKRM